MKRAVNVENFYDYWVELIKRYGDSLAIKDDYISEECTYNELFSRAKTFASGLRSLGLVKGDHLSLFSENNARWLIVDQALLISGMVDAVRGSAAAVAELEYIAAQSDSKALVVENLALLEKMRNSIETSNLKFVIHLSREHFDGQFPIPVYSFEQVMALGEGKEFVKENLSKDDLATLIYTSGTTGFPKGVMLSQGNLLSQVKNIHPAVDFDRDGKALTILPIWHSYERALEYYLLSFGGQLIYTNLKNFKPDIKKYQPHYLS